MSFLYGKETSMFKHIALIPARSASTRVRNKNIRLLKDHPLIAYTITAAKDSGIYKKIVVSTNSELIRDIALYYGADVPFLRPDKIATFVSPDIEWIKHAFSNLNTTFDCFSILRPTSPLRKPETIQRAWNQFLSIKNIDSLRAVELCKQHPGKMWVVEGQLMRPLLDQSHMEVAWCSRQYPDLPKIYVQNSSLEMAWTRVVSETNSQEGHLIAPFFTDEGEGFSIDYPEDFDYVKLMLKKGDVVLSKITLEPYKFK